MMKREDFDRLFKGFSEYDLISIAEIRNILTNEDNEREKFLDTDIKEYKKYNLSTTENRYLKTRLIAKLYYQKSYIVDFGQITFRSILHFGIQNLKKLDGIGKKSIDYLINIYKENGIDEIIEESKNTTINKDLKKDIKEWNKDKINKFLDTRIEFYYLNNDFRCNVRLMNVITEFCSYFDDSEPKITKSNITFRILLKLCNWNLDNLLHYRNFGKTTLTSLVDIYKSYGVNPYEYWE